MAALAATRRVKGAVLVSGIYDLEPLIGTSIDAALGLDPATAARNSPLRQALKGFPPSLVCWGENETDQFKRQSRAFAAGAAPRPVPSAWRSSVPAATTSTSSWIWPTPPRCSDGGRSTLIQSTAS